MLYKVFIDESGNKNYMSPYSRDFIDNPPPLDDYEDFWRNNYFVLCGIRVKQSDLKQINTAINKLDVSNKSTKKPHVRGVLLWLVSLRISTSSRGGLSLKANQPLII